jgi:hypothetical protein
MIVVLLFVTPISFWVKVWLTDKTDWRMEDYMCTIPEGCTEWIAERKRAREQKLIRTPEKSN